MQRPKSKDVTWRQIFHNIAGTVYQAEEDEDFYKVKVKRFNQTKFFYGETAYMDYQRYMYDMTLKHTAEFS